MDFLPVEAGIRNEVHYEMHHKHVAQRVKKRSDVDMRHPIYCCRL